MSNGLSKESARKQAKNALQRIDQIEADFSNLVQGVQQAFGQLQSGVNAMNEMLEAVVDLFGADKVNAQIQETRDAKAAEQATKAKEALDKAVTDGKYAVSETVTDDAVITGVESDKDGNILKPGYVQLAVQAIKPEFREKMKDQKVGFSFETAEGGKFEITGIFVAVPEKAEAAPAEA